MQVGPNVYDERVRHPPAPAAPTRSSTTALSSPAHHTGGESHSPPRVRPRVRQLLRGLDIIVAEAWARGLRVIFALTDFWRAPPPFPLSSPLFSRQSRAKTPLFGASASPQSLMHSIAGRADPRHRQDTGGIREFVSWSRGAGRGAREDFFSDRRCRELYKRHVRALLLRRNTVTGVVRSPSITLPLLSLPSAPQRTPLAAALVDPTITAPPEAPSRRPLPKVYREDPAILAWELINEPRCRGCAGAMRGWIREMAGFVKRVDPVHPLSVGCAHPAAAGDTPSPLPTSLLVPSAHAVSAHPSAARGADRCSVLLLLPPPTRASSSSALLFALSSPTPQGRRASTSRAPPAPTPGPTRRSGPGPRGRTSSRTTRTRRSTSPRRTSGAHPAPPAPPLLLLPLLHLWAAA